MIDLVYGAQAEVYPHVALGKIAAAGSHFAPLSKSARAAKHDSANRVARRFQCRISDEPDANPVALVARAPVSQYSGPAIQVVQDDVQAAGVEQISYSSPAGTLRTCDPGSQTAGNVDKLPVAEITKQKSPLHIGPEIHQWFPRLKYKERKILYKNLANGRFADISLQAGPGLLLEKSSRGCAFGDFDNDGDVDIVVSNINDLPTLLRNDGTSGGHWVKVKCIGTVSNRSAIGARVRVVVGAHSQIDEVRSGSSYISQNDLRLHFGLGSARTIDQLEIRWPSGTIESFENLAADRIYYLEEGVGKVRTSGPGAQPRSKNPPSP